MLAKELVNNAHGTQHAQACFSWVCTAYIDDCMQTTVLVCKLLAGEAHFVLATVSELLEDVTCWEAEVLRGEEVCTSSDEATVCEGRQWSPLSVGQAGACMQHTSLTFCDTKSQGVGSKTPCNNDLANFTHDEVHAGVVSIS